MTAVADVGNYRRRTWHVADTIVPVRAAVTAVHAVGRSIRLTIEQSDDRIGILQRIDEDVWSGGTERIGCCLARGNGNAPCTNRAPTGDVVLRVADHDDLANCWSKAIARRCRRLAPQVLLCGGQGDGCNIAPFQVLVAESAKFEMVPQAVVREFLASPFADISRQQSERYIAPSGEPRDKLADARQHEPLVCRQGMFQPR